MFGSKRFVGSALAVVSLAGASTAAPPMPTELDNEAQMLSRLFSYFGGVGSFTVLPSDRLIYANGCAAVDVAFRADAFAVAGFGIGTLGVSAPDLAVPAGADRFSATIEWPGPGSLSVFFTIREDDNGNGAIDPGSGDDEWETGDIMLVPGVQVYNLPYSAFVLSNPGEGNGVRNFNTTSRMAYFLTFETRASYPGGKLTSPRTLYVDHVGLYVGDQTIPPEACAADYNGDAIPDVLDFLDFMDDFSMCEGAATPCGAFGNPDLNGDAGVDVLDFLDFIEAFAIGCT
jgi:hypothetical protein